MAFHGFEVTDHIQKADRDAVYAGLTAYDRAHFENHMAEDLGVYVRDCLGAVIAGATGFTHGRWRAVQYLWVGGSLRGEGVGSGLLRQAEQAARERGCRYATRDTFDRQAPGFHQKQGYRAVLIQEVSPLAGRYYYFPKELWPGPARSLERAA